MADDADDKAYKKRVGKRARRIREMYGFTYKDVEGIIDQPTLARLEAGKRIPRRPIMAQLAAKYGMTAEQILGDAEVRSMLLASIEGNPKPLAFGDAKIDELFVAVGSPSDSLEIAVRYHATPFQYPELIAPLRNELIEHARREAEATGAMFWDGPTARLLGYTDGTSDSGLGYERRRLIVDAGPLSWFEFIVCNTFLDRHGLLANGSTIRKEYGKLEKLVTQPHDLAWYGLGNILQVAMTPITTDGHAIITRTRAGIIPATRGKLTCGVAENTQRWLDEAAPDDKWQAVHDIVGFSDLPPEGKRRDYQPRAISPYLTSLRGLKEELGFNPAELGNVHERVKFLSLVWDLVLFHSILIGVIELPFDRLAAERRILASLGKDHSEWSDIDFLALSPNSPTTIAKIADTTDWDVGGLASVVMAIQYWERQSTNHRWEGPA